MEIDDLILVITSKIRPIYTKWLDIRRNPTDFSKSDICRKIRRTTDTAGVDEIIDVIKKGIHGWAGHIARFKDKRWTKRVTEWTPRECTRQGRPKTRWRDSFTCHLGSVWPRLVRLSSVETVQGGVPPLGMIETLQMMMIHR